MSTRAILVSGLVFVSGCAPPPSPVRAAPSPAPTCAPAAPAPMRWLEVELRAMGPAARTIDVVVHHGTEACLVGNARHVTVRVDDKAQVLTLPCHPKGSRDWVIQAPAPSYTAAGVLVSDGTHRVSVRDDDTGHEDFEELAVPHIEIESGTLTVGAHVDAWVDKDATVVRGPTAVRVPGL